MINIIYVSEERKAEGLKVLKNKKYIRLSETKYLLTDPGKIYLQMFRNDADTIVIDMNKLDKRINLGESIRKIEEYKDSCNFILMFYDESYEYFLDFDETFSDKQSVKAIGF